MNSNEAEENLRVIRSLMEKATIYRAISAPTALVGGLAASSVGLALAWTADAHKERTLIFFGAWMLVLAITAAGNAFFIRRDARRRGEQFISPGMKMALWPLLPSHLTAAVVTTVAFALRYTLYAAGFCLLLPYAWCILYGLGLLAMNHFAPRSIGRLGWAFLLAGLLTSANAFLGIREIFGGGERLANSVMAATFGLFHLIYAGCTWPRGGRKVNI